MLSIIADRRRVLAKTVVYRVASVVVTVLVAWVVVGDVSTALDIGIAANAVKMGVYYAHERAWERVGRPDPAE